MIADMSILLVDDDESIRTSMEFFFRKKTRRFKSVASAELALDLLAADKDWDAVISDFKLPGMNGIAFLTRAQERRPQIKTALITAYASMDVVTEALRAGVHDFIQKPLKASMISDALERMTAKPGGAAVEVNLYADGAVEEKDGRWREDLEFTIQKVTHQMNNAFTALRGKAELGLCKTPEADTAERFTDILEILASAETLNKELMSFGKALSRRPFRPLDVLELIRHRILAQAGLIHAADIQLTVQNAAQGPFVASTCKEPLVHILDNILINAIQSVAGIKQPDKQITITASRQADKVIVAITDNGIGMNPETLERACSQGFTTKPDGNGLGLFITNRLCQVIKASMRMDSREGRGTTVTLALPGATVAARDRSEPCPADLPGDRATGARGPQSA
ncbi:MAG: response regulator [Desulfobacterales bacterium]|nr:response regulator [Desulfobacterales bacterium]